MANRKDERDVAERLDAYLDQSERDPELITREEARVVETLQHAVAEVTPRPGFLNELAQELRAREKAIMQQDNPQPLLFRVLAGGLTLVAAVAFVVIVAGLFARRPDEPALADLDNTPPAQPALIANAEQGFLAGAQIQVMEAPSGEPQQIAAYTVQPLPGSPDTIAEARAIAARFGMEDVRVYQQSPSFGLTVLAADGRSLWLSEPRGGAGGYYYSDPTVATDVGQTLPFAAAAAAAEAFLQAIDMAPQAYDFLPGDATPQAGLTTVRLAPLLDGRPVSGGRQMVVTVNGAGEVVSAHIIPFAAVPTGEMIDAGSARDALQQLLKGSGNYSYHWNLVETPDETAMRVFTRPAPERSRGETVTIEGRPTLLTDQETGETVVQLSSGPGIIYFVEGLELSELDGGAAMGGAGISVTGQLAERLGERAWRLHAQSWEPYDQQLDCRVGTVERADDGFYFYADGDEQRYLLAEAPEELEGGLRIDLCAAQFDPAAPLDWQHMTSPPLAEARSTGGGSGGSVVSVVEVPVEAPVTPTPAPLGENGSGVEERTFVVPPPPALPSESPYEPGDEVALTGRVVGQIRQDGDEREYEIVLMVDTDGDPATFPISFGLLGEPALLQAISEHYYMQVAVTGTVAPGSRWGQGIQVTAFERVAPEETLKAYLGTMTVATIEGRTVSVFVEESTGERFVFNPAAGVLGAGSDDDARTWIVGVVHADQTYGGLRVIEILTQSRGDSIDALQSADEMPFERTMPVYDPRLRVPRANLGDTLIVERIILGYRLEVVSAGPPAANQPPGEPTFTLQPAWHFEGRTADGQARFTIQLPIADGAPTTMLMPTATPLPLPGDSD